LGSVRSVKSMGATAIPAPGTVLVKNGRMRRDAL
jgi:hypothetical protein